MCVVHQQHHNQLRRIWNWANIAEFGEWDKHKAPSTVFLSAYTFYTMFKLVNKPLAHYFQLRFVGRGLAEAFYEANANTKY
jgi:hypothetical protein